LTKCSQGQVGSRKGRKVDLRGSEGWVARSRAELPGFSVKGGPGREYGYERPEESSLGRVVYGTQRKKSKAIKTKRTGPTDTPGGSK